MQKGCLLIILSLFLVSCKKPASLVVLETTDMHGEFNSSMASLSSFIRSAHQQYGKNLLLLDCGDNLQGTSTVFFYNYQDTSEQHIHTELFKWLPYTALTVGNHDIEAGSQAFNRVYPNLEIPILGANVIRQSNQRPYFKPYTILYRNGYKIAILGMVTPEALRWLPADEHEGLVFRPLAENTKYWVNRIHKKDKPDILIALIHCGLAKEEGDSDPSLEWAIYNIPGIDLVCCGHAHKASEIAFLNKYNDTVHVMEAGARAQYIAQAKIDITPRGFRKPDLSIQTSLIKADSLPEDPEFIQKFKPYIAKAEDFEKKRICALDTTIYSKDAMNGPCAWVDQLHKAYYHIAEKSNIGVDITFACSYTEDATLKKGDMTAGDFITLLPYENTLSIVEMTGYEIMDYMEYAYSLRLDRKNEPIYNLDSASGIYYTVDLSKPKGERVVITSTDDGNSFYPNKRYHVAMSTFRALGGGSHLIKQLGWSSQKMDSRKLWDSSDDLRTEIMEYYSQLGTVHPTAYNNWRFL